MGPSLTDIPRRLSAADSAAFEDKLVQKVLRNVDGRRDLKRIAVTCGIGEDAVLIVADELLQNGFIEIDDSSRIESLGGRRRGRSSGMYSQVVPSERPRSSSQVPSDHPGLSEERRAEIETYFARLETDNFYSLLGVAEDATKNEIRQAFFALSKRFHTDALFGVELGPYRQKMEAVFQRLTEAYDTLGRAKRRARYNRAQGNTVAPREDPMSDQPTAPHVSASNADSLSDAPTSTFRRLSDEEKRARRELHTRKLLAVTQQSEGRYRLASRPSVPVVETRSERPQPSSKPSAAPHRGRVGSAPKEGRISQATRELARSLKQTAQTTGGFSRAETYLQDAHRSAEDGDFHGAVNAIRLAINAAPERDDLRDIFAQYNAKLQEALAATARRRAEGAERMNEWQSAATAWRECCDAATDDFEAHLRAVDAGLRAGSELPECKRLAQRAVELAPEQAEARRLLAKVFIAAGMKLNAKRELKKALSLDPADKITQDMLRTLG